MTEGSLFDQLFDGTRERTLIVAELSASHGGSLDRALRLVELAAEAGADAVKIQTYRPDTITLDSDRDLFVRQGTIWEGRRLFDLYDEAHTPWEWHPELFERAEEVGIPMFSSPFDPTAVDLLEDLEAPAYKIGSFELVDIPLIERVGATGKPVVLSTGMATLAEIEEAVQAARAGGTDRIALLKTNSAYPSPPDEIHLETIGHLSETFGVIVGVSDHTIGAAVPTAAVARGARIVEKHLCVSRTIETPDSAFATEPGEFARMVQQVRTARRAVGRVHYGPTSAQEASIDNRRSLFAVEGIDEGERLTADNVKSIRPADGLHPRYYDRILGGRATRSIERGTPLSWEMLLNGRPNRD